MNTESSKAGMRDADPSCIPQSKGTSTNKMNFEQAEHLTQWLVSISFDILTFLVFERWGTYSSKILLFYTYVSL
jgi:hypothetical protein